VPSTPQSTPTADIITTTWRQESATLVAALTRMTRDVGLAEDLAQDALVAAMEQWPESAPQVHSKGLDRAIRNSAPGGPCSAVIILVHRGQVEHRM